MQDITIPNEVAQAPDPFYNEENIVRLLKAITDVKSGKAKLTEHELIEDEND